MMVPDYALILEIYLYSHGIMNANIFAAKITNLYRLCSEQVTNMVEWNVEYICCLYYIQSLLKSIRTP